MTILIAAGGRAGSRAAEMEWVAGPGEVWIATAHNTIVTPLKVQLQAAPGDSFNLRCRTGYQNS